MPPKIPTKLGRYEVLDELGKGAMGVVYLARDPLIGRLLALKTFRITYGMGSRELEQFRARFIREAQSCGILNHPNIVTIHDVVDQGEDGAVFIAMEYVQGTDLKELIHRGEPLPLKFVVNVVCQIADALDYAHAKGVVHRDVKPANIILTADDQAKITDFGIARINTSSLTQDGQLLGTPNYMAPEQVQGQEVDHRADIFALGVVLYEMITHSKPFQGDNLTVVTHKIVFSEPPPLEPFVVGELPKGMDEVVRRALAKNPQERYQRARELSEALRQLPQADDTQDLAPLLAELQSPPAAEGTGSGSFAAGSGTRDGPLVIPPPPPPPAPLPPPVVAAEGATAPAPLAPPALPAAAPAVAAPAVSRAGARRRRWGLWGLALVAAVLLLLAVLMAVRQKPSAAGGEAAWQQQRTSWEQSFTARLEEGRTLLQSSQLRPAATALRDAEAMLQARQALVLEESERLLQAGQQEAVQARQSELGGLDERGRELRQLRQQAEWGIEELQLGQLRTAAVAAQLKAAREALDGRRYVDVMTAAQLVLELEPGHEEAAAMVESIEARAAQERRAAAAEAAPAPLPPPPVSLPDPGATAAPPVRLPPPPAVDSTAPASLMIDFETELARGSVLIYLGSDVLLRENFRVRKGRPETGRLEKRVEIPAGTTGELKIYVSDGRNPATVRQMQANFPGGSARRLEIRVDAEGGLVTRLR